MASNHRGDEQKQQQQQQQPANSDNSKDDHSIALVSSQLDSESLEQYKEMLKLGEEVSTLYRNIQNELSRPVIEATLPGCESDEHGVVVDYKPVMKKRVYHLNGAYLKGSNGLEHDFGTHIQIILNSHIYKSFGSFLFLRQ